MERKRKYLKYLSLLAVWAVVFAVFFAAAPDAQAENRDFIAADGIVSVAHPLASQAGLEILRKGGNAFDAAVAASFALGVAEPAASGIGGGGVAILYVAKENKSYVVDFQDVGPAKANANVWPRDREGKIMNKAKRIGYLSVCVPGQARGMEVISQKFGSLAWADVLAPAVRLADEGLPVSGTLNSIIMESFSDMNLYPSGAFFERHFLEGGLPKSAGEVVRNTDLAKTLRKIAAGGADAVYKGEIADAIVKEFARPQAGGWITKEDMANYRVIIREPVVGSYRGYDVYLMPPPSAGVTVMQILNIMEGYELGDKIAKDSGQFNHIFVEAQKLAWADQDKYAGDPDFVRVPVKGMISKKYADTQRKRINPAKAGPKATAGDPPADESASTTSFSIIDKEGNMITVTQTIGHFFGAGIVPPGTGILMNDHMDTFSQRASSPNAPQGGKRVFSSIAGAILVKDGKPFLTLGSPGAARIISTVAQVIINVVDYRMNLQEAINAPRIHNRNAAATYLEGGYPAALTDELTARGHKITVLGVHDLYFGGVQGAMYMPDGKLHGCADPRRDGVAAGY
ncbi:MAG: gamma-glutamyltransferase [Acidaminococcales bacterium]|jgi:gamma-glutamyltranspeptidase/glutathione hydrolase|nr:gamma-glutamyltransferase [Acidaminococcales bacterium]